MLTIIAGVRIKGGSTSLKRSRRARGATRLVDRRLGANSACRSDLSAETSERLLVFMTFSTFLFRCQRDHVGPVSSSRIPPPRDRPEAVPLISGDPVRAY